MLSFVTLDEKTEEIPGLRSILKELAATLTEEQWSMEFFETLQKFQSFVEEQPLLDMACFDVTPPDNQSSLIDFRKLYSEAQLMLLADTSVSPTVYLKPGVRADSLMLRPFNTEGVRQSLKEFIESYLDKLNDDKGENLFTVEDRDGKISIPYKDIFYFESKEKKVFVRTLNDEYGFYSTLEKLEETLPEEFVRCHRSFIINKSKLKGVYLSQNYVELTHDFEVPLSRSYKATLKTLK